MKKMKPHIKKLWVDALRSGKYKQGGGVLRSDGCFCCLGVLTDLYDKRTGHHNAWPKDNAMPAMRVCRWAALDADFEWDDNDEETAVDPEYSSTPASILAKMNDKGRTFKQIAAYIERYL